jgi:hypothetical protein
MKSRNLISIEMSPLVQTGADQSDFPVRNLNVYETAAVIRLDTVPPHGNDQVQHSRGRSLLGAMANQRSGNVIPFSRTTFVIPVNDGMQKASL